MKNKVLVTAAIGKAYNNHFRKKAYKSWLKYADRYEYDLLVFDEVLDKRSLQKGRHLGWEKLNVMTHDRVLKYDQAVWLDTDIWLNQRAPDICKKNSVEYFGAVNAFAYPSHQENQLALHEAESIWRSRGWNGSVHFGAEEFYKKEGVKTEIKELIQSGVIVFSPKKIHDCVRNCYETWVENPISCSGEMQWLSAALLEAYPCDWLDPKYNADWIIHQCLYGQNEFKVEELRKTNKPRVDKLFFNLQKIKALVGLPYQKKNILQSFLKENYFLHFCGDSRDLWFIKNVLDK